MDALIKAYYAGWRAVEEIELQELQSATVELRWQQLNALIGLAIRLGIFEANEDELNIYRRWARLKEEAF